MRARDAGKRSITETKMTEQDEKAGAIGGFATTAATPDGDTATMQASDTSTACDATVVAARLPAEYDATLALTGAMLVAAESGDWTEVTTLRRRIPTLAVALSRRWAEIGLVDAAAQRRLERERLASIRRILAVDERIRRLADPGRGPVHDWLHAGASRRVN